MTAWNSHQEAIFAAVQSKAPADRNIVIEALAGSGKTTTAIEAMALTPANATAVALAFNKPIAAELKARVPEGVEALTFHSFGLRAITNRFGRFSIEGDRIPKILRDRLGKDRKTREAREAVKSAVSLAKNCLIDSADDLDEACDEIGIDFPEDWDRQKLLDLAAELLEDSFHCDATGEIDFDDMIWLPIVRRVPIEARDWLFVDEAQDLNEAQLALVRRACKGRMMAIGDSRQAIYGFRGAAAGAIGRIAAAFEARTLALPITYRCGLAIVKEAQKLVPELLPAPDAREGLVLDSTLDDLRQLATPGDLVVSRLNAPLVNLAIGWLKAGKPCSIRGHNIGEGLAKWLQSRKAKTCEDLLRSIDRWEVKEKLRLEENDRDGSNLADRAACLRSIVESCETPDEAVKKAWQLFEEGIENGIQLTSTHRAKGLEAERVWVLRDTFRPADGGEERNLLYVAITRAKSELIYCHNKEN